MGETSVENVADLIGRPPEKYVREPRYVSKYREQVRKAAKRGKSAHKTLGVPSVNLNPPTQYLKKNSNKIKRPEVHHKHYHRPGYQHKLPEWKPINANDREAQSQTVDFTKRNIDEAANLRPRKARKFYVDDRHGNSHPLKTSGLYPLYRNKKHYGQYSDEDSGVPEHRTKIRGINGTNQQPGKNVKTVNKFREENPMNKRDDKMNFEKQRKMQQEKTIKLNDERFGDLLENLETGESSKVDEAKAANSEGKSTKSGTSLKTKASYISNKEKDDESIESSRPQQPRCRYVTEDERAELLYGMKKKWDEMMHQFQTLPFLTDTPPKAKRKSKMEKDLYQLEKDIEVIERHPYIYVYSDDEEES